MNVILFEITHRCYPLFREFCQHSEKQKMTVNQQYQRFAVIFC